MHTERRKSAARAYHHAGCGGKAKAWRHRHCAIAKAGSKSSVARSSVDPTGNRNRQPSGGCLLAAARLSYRSRLEALLSGPPRRQRDAQNPADACTRSREASRREELNDYVVSLLLGIVEGLTEFLPVSSTAHLRLTEALLHIDLASGYWKMYTIVIQLGAILCLPVYFRARIAKFFSTFPRGERGDRTALTHPLGLTMVAFVVTAIPAFPLTKGIGKHIDSLYILGASLL